MGQACHGTPPHCPCLPPIKRPRRRRQPPFPSPFPLHLRAPLTAAQCRLAIVLAHHLSIPRAQRPTEASQCFCPRFCSSSSTPSTATPDPAAANHRFSVSSFSHASHHWQRLQLDASCPLPPHASREPSQEVLLLGAVCPPRRCHLPLPQPPRR
jgi:hypothetical protein